MGPKLKVKSGITLERMELIVKGLESKKPLPQQMPTQQSSHPN